MAQPATTTIRVDREVHRRLVKLGEASGRQLIDVVRDAATALERQLFARSVISAYETLQSDPAAWEAYLADAELAVNDGLAR